MKPLTIKTGSSIASCMLSLEYFWERLTLLDVVMFLGILTSSSCWSGFCFILVKLDRKIIETVFY